RFGVEVLVVARTLGCAAASAQSERADGQCSDARDNGRFHGRFSYAGGHGPMQQASVGRARRAQPLSSVSSAVVFARGDLGRASRIPFCPSDKRQVLARNRATGPSRYGSSVTPLENERSMGQETCMGA